MNQIKTCFGGIFVFLVVSILCSFFGKCFCVSLINKLSNLELAHYQNKQTKRYFPSICHFPVASKRERRFSSYILCSHVLLSVCAFVDSGTDVMPGRAIRPIFMSLPGFFSYFLVIPKCFQNTIVRIMMIFRRKPRM